MATYTVLRPFDWRDGKQYKPGDNVTSEDLAFVLRERQFVALRYLREVNPGQEIPVPASQLAAGTADGGPTRGRPRRAEESPRRKPGRRSRSPSQAS